MFHPKRINSEAVTISSSDVGGLLGVQAAQVSTINMSFSHTLVLLIIVHTSQFHFFDFSSDQRRNVRAIEIVPSLTPFC